MATCPNCRLEIPANAPAGLCPVCAIGLAQGKAKSPADLPTREFSGEQPDEVPSPEMLSRLLPQFEVEELIGVGGMGAVYRARQPKLDRPVALKIMSRKFARQPAFAERFAREARTLARLNHPQIVSVFDFGEVNGFYYLVMEYVDGINLREAIAAGKLPAEEVLQIVQQVCEALQFAHDQGVVHRDIKPENILLDQRGRVKIADFGLAKLTADPQLPVSLTGTRQVLGTFNYMAPEQIEKPGSVDHRADIYSLGVVLYELLTGELPMGRFQLPGEKQARYAPLDQVVARTLEKEPQRRYQQASEVRTAVEEARSDSRFHPIRPQLGRRPANAAPIAQPVPPATQPAAARDHLESTVPFRIGNPNTGYKNQTDGMLELHQDELVIHYTSRDPWFNTELFGHSGEHRLPLAQVAGADFKEGWFSHSLTVKHKSPDDFRGIRAEKRGSLRFQIASEDIEDAERLVNRLRNAIGQAPLPSASVKPEAKRARAQQRLSWLGIAMVLVGLVNTAFFPLLMIALLTARSLSDGTPPDIVIETSARALSDDQAAGNNFALAHRSEGTLLSEAPLKSGMKRSDLAAAVPEREAAHDSATFPAEGMPANAAASLPEAVPLASPEPAASAPATWLTLLSCGLFFVIGMLVFSGGICILNLRHWTWAVTMAILCIVPLHPGAILGGFIVGIWALVELFRYSNRTAFVVPAAPL